MARKGLGILWAGSAAPENPLLETKAQILPVVTRLLEFGSVLLRVEHRFPLFNIASLYF